MPKEQIEIRASETWEKLAETYASSRQVSADSLIEWPAQRKMCGDFAGKRVLDVGCGTGEKARFFAEHGASSVVAVDPSDAFSRIWNRAEPLPNLFFEKAGFEDLPRLGALPVREFDLIVSFQALMYAADLRAALASMASLLVPGGNVVVSVPHPFRFAVLRSEREGGGHGHAYQQTSPYKYPSPWDDKVFLQHATPRVSDYANAILAAGLRIDAMEEPGVTDELRAVAPDKAAWMDRYIGIVIFKAHRGA